MNANTPKAHESIPIGKNDLSPRYNETDLAGNYFETTNFGDNDSLGGWNPEINITNRDPKPSNKLKSKISIKRQTEY